MDINQELLDRRFYRKCVELSQTAPLSHGAQNELRLALKTTPDRFEVAPADAAFAQLARIQDELARAERTDEYKDDDEYSLAWEQRVEQFRGICQDALALFPSTMDAQRILAMSDRAADDTKLERLELLVGRSRQVLNSKLKMERLQTQQSSEGTYASSKLVCTDAAPTCALWDNPFMRPYLRTMETLTRAYVRCCRYRIATDLGEDLLSFDPDDHTQVRNSLALAYARCEDERKLTSLLTRFNHQGTPWTHLAMIVLLYKQDRMPAFRRALSGFVQLYESAAYALLRPTMPQPQVLGRADVKPGSYRQLVQAVSECEAILADCPDLLAQAAEHEKVKKSAEAFAKKYGFDF